MLKRELGTTNIQVSPIGLGTVKFGRNTKVRYPKEFSIPSLKQLANLLALAADLGINLLDTAPAYGTSEETLGKILKNQRDKWVIVNKVGENFINNQSSYNYRPEHIVATVENSLRLINTDYLDVLLIHSNGNDLEIIEQYEVFVTLGKLKQKGYIKSFGMSSKTVAGGLATVEQSDIVMATYNLNYQDELIVINRAEKLNKGVLIKKAFASGHLDLLGKDPVRNSIEYILQHKGISSIIIGTISDKHLFENVQYVNQCLNKTLYS